MHSPNLFEGVMTMHRRNKCTLLNMITFSNLSLHRNNQLSMFVSTDLTD